MDDERVERDERVAETVGYGGRLVSGSFVNMVAIFVVFLCGFFLTPFLLARLGPEQYAILILAQSVVGFFPLLNLGVPASLSRLLTLGLTRRDPTELSRSFSAGLAFLLGAGVVALLVGSIVVLALPRIFDLSPESTGPARWVFGLLVLQMALALPFLAYRSVYDAAQRFRIPSGARIVMVPLRTAAIFALFLAGHISVVLWAAIQVISEILEGAYLAIRARRIVPALRTRLASVTRREVRGLVGFSTWIFLGSVGYLLYYNTDYLLIHWFVGPAEVAHYSLAARWDPILRTLVGAIANPVTPIAAALWETRREDELRALFLRTSRYVMALALPSCLLLAIFSEPFLVNWAGPDYGRDWRVLVILMVPLVFSLVHGPTASVYVGLGRTKFNGILTLGFAVANVVLSVYFVRVLGWGLEGIALGTALTYLLRTGVLSPWYVCRITGIPLRRYATRVVIRPMVAAVPMVAVALALRNLWSFDSLAAVGLAMVLSAATFPILGWWLILDSGERASLEARLRRRRS